MGLRDGAYTLPLASRLYQADPKDGPKRPMLGGGLVSVWGCGVFSVGRYPSHFSKFGHLPIQYGLGLFQPGYARLVIHGSGPFNLLLKLSLWGIEVEQGFWSVVFGDDFLPFQVLYIDTVEPELGLSE